MTRPDTTRCAALAAGVFIFLLLLTVPAAAQTPLLDLDNSSAAAVADIHDDGGFVVRGTYGTGAIPVSGEGTRMMWHPAKAAFRAGRIDGQGPTYWDDAEIGPYSAAFGIVPRVPGIYAFGAGYGVEATNDGATAFGFSTLASGFTSFAAGYQSDATGHSAGTVGRLNVSSGNYSFTYGYQNTAGGNFSFAGGGNNVASGSYSVALGSANQAPHVGSVALGRENAAYGASSLAAGFESATSGDYAVAIGQNNSAFANNALALGTSTHTEAAFSTVIGQNVGTANSHTGSFAWGDGSTTIFTQVVRAANQFAARASGGVAFYSSGDLSSGVTLAAGGSSWASVSDVNRKENFVGLEDAYVLDALEAMPIQEWNYITQEDDVRHIGPTAQDFHAAFGLGSDPLRIETIDADGVALAAIQALIRENRALRARVAELEEMEDRVDALEADRERLAELETRLEALLTALESTGEIR